MPLAPPHRRFRHLMRQKRTRYTRGKNLASAILFKVCTRCVISVSIVRQLHALELSVKTILANKIVQYCENVPWVIRSSIFSKSVENFEKKTSEFSEYHSKTSVSLNII